MVKYTDFKTKKIFGARKRLCLILEMLLIFFTELADECKWKSVPDDDLEYPNYFKNVFDGITWNRLNSTHQEFKHFVNSLQALQKQFKTERNDAMGWLFSTNTIYSSLLKSMDLNITIDISWKVIIIQDAVLYDQFLLSYVRSIVTYLNIHLFKHALALKDDLYMTVVELNQKSIVDRT